MAGYLIHKSYSAWQGSPVATSITTHPIAELDMPTVTVCPPKGSKTALNYDLMKADNNSLTDQQRVDLKHVADTLFLAHNHEDFIKMMGAIANLQNMGHMFAGYQSVPKPLGRNGFEIIMWNNSGTFHTPWYHQEYQEGYYTKEKDYLMILQFPVDIVKLVGHGTLVIQLEVDTREMEGWIEEVTYRNGSKYNFYPELLAWVDAEAFCKDKGGHLATVLTLQEQQEVAAVASAGGESVWVGGTDQQEEGIWKWTRGSSLNYTNWYVGQPNGGSVENCLFLMMDGLKFGDINCSQHLGFVCQMDTVAINRKPSTTLQIKAADISFPSIEVLYSYRPGIQDLVTSWKEKRMTGFQVSWSIENPPLYLTTKEVGKSITTPGLGDNYEITSYLDDHTYKATLLIPDNFVDRVGNGSLVIDLKVNTREEEGWQEEVTWTEYKVHTNKKTWSDAEAHCQSEGGHLISVLDEEEQQKIMIATGEGSFWIGASDQGKEGAWTWTDGSPWGYSSWSPKYDNGINTNCALKSDRTWYYYYCTQPLQFICKFHHQIRGNTSMRREYTNKDIVFPSITIEYSYNFSSKQLLDSWVNKRMTGFRLSWYFQDINGTRLTDSMPDVPADWRQRATEPRYQEPQLVKMVILANRARGRNMAGKELVKRVMQEKIAIVHSGDLKYGRICKGGQVKAEHFPEVFAEGIKNVQISSPQTEIIIEDVLTGFMIYSAIVYCSESVAVAQFLHSLLSTQSPRTIIQATVNTIQSESVQERANKMKLNTFYLALDQKFDFQLGRILLATSSPSELQAMIAKEWPFFTHHTKEIDQCLSGASCQKVAALVDTLGNLK